MFVTVRDAVLIGTAFLLAAAAPLASVALAPPPPGDGPVLVIARDAADAVAAAGGRLIGPAQAPFAALASGGPDFVSQLSQGQAWRVIAADTLAAICNISPSQDGTS